MADSERDDALKLWIEASITHPTDQHLIHLLQVRRSSFWSDWSSPK
jgi:hypothetical protein